MPSLSFLPENILVQKIIINQHNFKVSSSFPKSFVFVYLFIIDLFFLAQNRGMQSNDGDGEDDHVSINKNKGYKQQRRGKQDMPHQAWKWVL